MKLCKSLSLAHTEDTVMPTVLIVVTVASFPTQPCHCAQGRNTYMRARPACALPGHSVPGRSGKPQSLLQLHLRAGRGVSAALLEGARRRGLPAEPRGEERAGLPPLCCAPAPKAQAAGSCPSRAKCTDPSAKKCLVMDADDEAVLNLIAECEWGLSNPPGSSSQKECESDFHGPQESGRPSSSQSVQHQCGDCVKRGREQRRGGSRGCIPEQRPPGQHHGEQPGGQPRALHSPRPHVHLIPHPGSTDGEDSAPPSQRSSLSAQTVSTPVPAAEKCRKRRLPGGRLQAPVHQVWPSGLGERGEHPSGPSSTAGSSRRDSSRSEASWLEEQGPRRSGSAREVSPKLQLAVPPGKQASLEVALLEALLDLVDRYWSGCKSLHGNEVFLAQARHILSSVEEFTATQDNSTIMSEEIRYLALENKSLQNRLADQQQQYSLKIHEVLSDLDSARKEMDDLRQQLDRSSEENNNLKSLLFSMKKEAQSTDSSAALSSQIPGFRSSKCCEMGLEPTRVVPQVVLAQEWVRAGRGPCGYSLLPPSEPVEARGGPWLWRPSAPRPLGVCPAVALLLGPDRGRRSRSPWPLFLPDSDRFYCPLFTLVGCVLRFRRSALGLQVQILGFRTRSCRRCSLWKLLRG
ncbi:centrosomal protein of 72 kDa isoform X3 [Rousettus aegyptiacus]|uniref:centrosomal protein of 72 kDa isoform X3 n=1 Tax=Rousettus aegyptiacus TaxID=9407 RepID=UPI00168D64B3|nr:centrosomal protein of 72 kDa isoform X3 [Rousettus aegyptiacus]XP_036081561.1 centrosomal protein of 72 kDa isoform X3 [Rousettus aegyptiacus]